MADDNVIIIEGAVKFREGKKWKSRWCTLRKLSPAADCVLLSVARVCASGAGAVLVSARLAGFTCSLAGFTLDGAGHTLALLTRDDTYTLAFDEPETLLRWQVKVSSHLGASMEHSVCVLEAGLAPDRVDRVDRKKVRDVTRRGGAVWSATRLVVGRALVLVGDTPPRALVVWDYHHLRQYGVCEGRVVVVGGARAGRGAGVWRVASDSARDCVRDIERAARGTLARRGYTRAAVELDSPLSGRASSRSESRLSELCDTSSVLPAPPTPLSPHLPRCTSCLSALVSPPAPSLPPSYPPVPQVTGSRPRVPRSLSAALRPVAWGPTLRNSEPTQHYDSPRLQSKNFAQQIDDYYDTPKRLKDCLEEKYLRSLPKSKTSDSLIFKKTCGCLLRVGRGGQKEAFVIETEESVGEVQCACQKVAEWTKWVRLPYCRKGPINKENSVPVVDRSVLYATVDFSRKMRRRGLFGEGGCETSSNGIMSKGLDASQGRTVKPLPNYENLKFAQSLEHYENSKDVIGRFNSLRQNVSRPSCREQYVSMRPVAPRPRHSPRVPSRSTSQPELLTDCCTASRVPHRARCNSAESRTSVSLATRDVTSSSETLRARDTPGTARDSSSSGDSGVCVRDSRGDTNSSAEAELPVAIRGPGEMHSSSSGASDMSDYVETLSLCSSHSSDAPNIARCRVTVSALRPRSGAEYVRPALE